MQYYNLTISDSMEPKRLSTLKNYLNLKKATK